MYKLSNQVHIEAEAPAWGNPADPWEVQGVIEQWLDEADWERAIWCDPDSAEMRHRMCLAVRISGADVDGLADYVEEAAETPVVFYSGFVDYETRVVLEGVVDGEWLIVEALTVVHPDDL